MAQEIRTTRGTDGPPGTPPGTPETARTAAGEPSIGELFRELAQESSVLIRQEVALAKAEMRENVAELGRGAAMIAAGGAVLLVAMLVLTAFLVAALGDLLGNEYWLGALIVGGVYAIVGAVLLLRGKKALQNGEIRPEQTIQSLQADKRWAQAEAQQVKRDLTT